MTLAEFFDTRYRVDHPLEPSTEHFYRKFLRRFDAWLGREALLTDLTDATAKRFFKAAPRAKGAILPIWRYAVACGLLPTFEHRELLRPRRIHRSLDRWSKPEFAAILAAVQTATGVDRATGIPHAAYWTALVRTIHETQLHYSVIMRLTAAEASRLSLSRAARAAIEALKPETRPTIFGYGLSRTTFQKLRHADFRRLLHRALSTTIDESHEASEACAAGSFASLINSIDD